MGFSGLSMLLLLFATILLPNIAVAKIYRVGDQNGRTNGFDYQAWAAGKKFAVGDILAFRNPVRQYILYRVNGTALESCTVPPLSEALAPSGIYIISLATPGRKWYVCGVIGDQCQDGQKLVIDVKPSGTLFPPILPPLLSLHTAPMPRYTPWKL